MISPVSSDPSPHVQEVHDEIAYALDYAEKAPSNESPWNYVRGFFRTGGRLYADFPKVKARAIELQVRFKPACSIRSP